MGITLYGRAEANFHEQLPVDAIAANNLLLCDIEGAEFELFTSEVIEAFSHSTFIIEIHDFKFPDDKQIKQNLIDKFKNFNVEMIVSKPKQWSNIPQIASLGDNDRALICYTYQ